MKKILVIFGTRPEAIKLAPIIIALKKAKRFDVITCITAQHREMLDQILYVFSIKPDIDLNLMQYNQGLNQLMGSALISLDAVLKEIKPDLVLIQGDTTTVLATALACYHNKVKVAHVEAGLRTFDKFSPFPEEINRSLTGRIADWHFAPTTTAANNLLQEGVNKNDVFITGNSVIDALMIARTNVKQADVFKTIDLEVQTLINSTTRKVLVTSHRRENFGDGIKSICEAILKLAINFPDVSFVYPVHLNPNIKQIVFQLLNNTPNIKLLKPLDYLSFVALMDNAYLILTDSGGVQEEAPTLGKPVLVLRNTTERPEALEVGASKLIGTEASAIYKNVSELLCDESKYNNMCNRGNPYGDGLTSERICNFIQERL
ncbi:MAG: UDP-N-acetylglucosamine 2-epimerase (non-hydrolyzing) [Agriterribacter sp.]